MKLLNYVLEFIHNNQCNLGIIANHKKIVVSLGYFIEFIYKNK